METWCSIAITHHVGKIEFPSGQVGDNEFVPEKSAISEFRIGNAAIMDSHVFEYAITSPHPLDAS